MYPSRRSLNIRQNDLTLEKMMKYPENFTFVKCEKFLERLNGFYSKDEPKLFIYIIHDNNIGYSGD